MTAALGNESADARADPCFSTVWPAGSQWTSVSLAIKWENCTCLPPLIICCEDPRCIWVSLALLIVLTTAFLFNTFRQRNFETTMASKLPLPGQWLLLHIFAFLLLLKITEFLSVRTLLIPLQSFSIPACPYLRASPPPQKAALLVWNIQKGVYSPGAWRKRSVSKDLPDYREWAFLFTIMSQGLALYPSHSMASVNICWLFEWTLDLWPLGRAIHNLGVWTGYKVRAIGDWVWGERYAERGAEPWRSWRTKSMWGHVD